MTTGSVNGATIARELYQLVREMTHDVEKSNRETARQAAAAELAHGLDEAQAMHEQAADMLTGAIVSGSMRVASGLGQATMAALTFAETSPPDGYGEMGMDDKNLALREIEADTKWHGAAAGGFATLNDTAGSVNGAFDAGARKHEAEAATARAQARADVHNADDARSQANEARETDKTVRQELRAILDSQHESMMAAINVRG